MTLTQQTVQQLLQLIRDEGLAVGDFLPKETALMSQLGVSRGVLREALSYLKGLGILSSRRGSGFHLREVNPVTIFDNVMHQLSVVNTSDIRELLLLRMTLETGAIERAVLQASKEEIEEIQRLSKALREITTNPACTLAEYELLEADFHIALMKPAGVRLLTILNLAIREYFRNSAGEGGQGALVPENIQRSNDEHDLIAKAFQLRQPETALHAIRHHLRHAEARLMDI